MEDNSIILNELVVIKNNIIALREELADRTLSQSDLIAIEDYEKEKDENSLISHEKIKKELNDAKD